jgi:hypothetical protein
VITSTRLAAAAALFLGLLCLGLYALFHGFTGTTDVLHRAFVGVALLCASIGAVWLISDLFV